MNIQISEQYRISSDSSNVIIQEKRVKKEDPENVASDQLEQKENWVNVSYHPNLLSACIRLLDLVVFKSEAETVEALLNEQKKMRGEILVALAKRE